MYSLKSVSGETRFGRILPISRKAFLVTMLSSMFWVTRVSPKSKKIALASATMLPQLGHVSSWKDLALLTAKTGPRILLMGEAFHVFRLSGVDTPTPLSEQISRRKF